MIFVIFTLTCYFNFGLLFLLWLVIFTLTCYFLFDLLFSLWFVIILLKYIVVFWVCVLALLKYVIVFRTVIFVLTCYCFYLSLFVFWTCAFVFVLSVPLGFLPWILPDFMLLFWKICLRAVRYFVPWFVKVSIDFLLVSNIYFGLFSLFSL